MSKQSDLQALANAVRLFVDQEVPTVGQWNVDPQVLIDALNTLGSFFSQVDAAHAALQTLFNADHNQSTGANPVPSEWVTDPSPASFVSASQFQLSGDRRTDYAVGHRVRATMGASTPILSITAASFVSGATTFTVDPPVLTSQLTAVARGLVRYSVPRVTAADIFLGAIVSQHIASGTIQQGNMGVLSVGTQQLINAAVTGQKIADLTITKEKIALGAGFRAATWVGFGYGVISNTTTPTIISTLGTITLSGGSVMLDFSGPIGIASCGSFAATVTLTVLRNGSPVYTIVHDLDQVAGFIVKTPINLGSYFDYAPPAGNTTYSLRVTLSTASAALFLTQVNGSRWSARELL